MEWNVGWKLNLHGMEGLVTRLQDLGQRRARAAMRRAVGLAATPILQTARQLVAVDSRLLRQSLGRRIKTYSTGTTVVVVGPRRGMKREVKTRRGVQTRDPVRYAHLVEGGHAIVVPMGTGAGRRLVSLGAVPGRPFMRPALERNQERAVNMIRRELEAAIGKG